MTTKTVIRSLTVIVALLAAQAAIAQAPSGAPAGATGICKDGSYSTAAKKQGACRGHQGVKEWYAPPDTSGKTAPASTGTSAPAAAPASPASAPVKPAPTKAPASAMAQAPAGGAGQVWLNTSSNVYHCPGTRYYGKTKAGAYMTEAEAKAKGGRPDHGKACQ